ncbi:hypothetical protein DOV67_27975 [Salmonella enterica subsp. enterica serovar Java]|uniref:Uncharacterized protein n=3 Tax=Salmonella enterica TaxID=28901 RepID=A0A3R0U2B5_SALER|nr:hypothetical protein [Salmonella enterica subsp. enterica serovar Java]EBR8575285.1 hypothetical protein [Salmonella enterica subsp. enterica serovar Java]ECS8432493.1 hypothetical protein [Salmonella enterica]MLE30271.1 hypothetical protein [Salmonella enterica]
MRLQMMQKINGLRHKRFSDAAAPGKVRDIRGRRAWLNVQQMLKRSGRHCVSGKTSKEKKEEPVTDTFNFEDVCHLYQLYRTVERIKAGSSSGATIELEICELKRGRLHWPYNFVIAPKRLRRKADAHRQMDSIDHHVPCGFKGSLYRALLDFFGDSKKLDIALAESLFDDPPLLSLQQIIANGSSSFVFTLLEVECRRLGFRHEAMYMRNYACELTTEQSIEKFGEALFFTFLYHTSEEDLFSSFFSKSLPAKCYPKIPHDSITLYIQIMTERRRSEILDFIEVVSHRFFCTAYSRKKIQKKKDSDVKK